MQEIEKINLIKRENLDEKNYFTSLINEACKLGIISDAQLQNLQLQCIALLKKRIAIYSGPDSTSIRNEEAEKIMESNLYTISLALKKFSNPDEAAKELIERNISDIFDEGKKIIYTKIQSTKLMYAKVLKNKMYTSNFTYNDTLIGGISGFFKLYNPEFEAQNIKITADYPLYNEIIGKIDGIEFIQKYLEYISLENEFCSYFSLENIHYLLSAYSKDYEDLIINIFEIVLISVIGCKLAESDINQLTITAGELQKIYELMYDKNEDEVYILIDNAYKTVKTELFSEKNKLHKYIESNFFEVKFRIWNLLKLHNLDKVFIVKKFV